MCYQKETSHSQWYPSSTNVLMVPHSFTNLKTPIKLHPLPIWIQLLLRTSSRHAKCYELSVSKDGAAVTELLRQQDHDLYPYSPKVIAYDSLIDLMSCRVQPLPPQPSIHWHCSKTHYQVSLYYFKSDPCRYMSNAAIVQMSFLELLHDRLTQ